MSQADELLKSAASTLTVNPDTEAHIVIDESRNITVPDELKRIAVQYDHDIETVTFDCPRYWDGHDLSEMSIYINYARPDESLGSYLVDDVTVDEEDDTIMHFTWTISGHVSEIQGKISFLVCAKKSGEVVVGQQEHPAGIKWIAGDKISERKFGPIIYADGKFVTSGYRYNNSIVYYSYDGATWLEGNGVDVTGGGLDKIAYGDGKFVGINWHDINGGNHVYYSYDGVTWTEGNIDAAGNYSLENITYGDGKFVIGDSSGKVYHSTDGINWTLEEGANNYSPTNTTYGDGKFVGVGNAGDVYYSIDGFTWSPGNGPKTTDIMSDVIYGTDRFVTVGNKGVAFYSEDGVNWIASETGVTKDFEDISYDGNYFVAVGEGCICYSADGITWTVVEDIEDIVMLNGVAYGDGKFITVGSAGAMYTSTSYTTDIYETQLTNHWNTELNDDMYISEGLETEKTIIESNPDIFQQLIVLMTETETSTSQHAENAQASANSAATSAAKAEQYFNNLSDEAAQAAASAAEAKISETNAKTSEDAAKISETNAAQSEANATQFVNEAMTALENGDLVGPQGPEGPQGTSITSVKQTTPAYLDGETNIVTITLSDGTESNVYIKNGSKGEKGDTGDMGVCDDALDITSTNAVQNAVITDKITTTDKYVGGFIGGIPMQVGPAAGERTHIKTVLSGHDEALRDLGGSVVELLRNAGTGGVNIVDITSADYEALENKETDTNLYNITDADEYIKAENVEYGDSDVKTELDELNSNLDNIGEILSKAAQGGTIANNTCTDMASITIPKGTWIIQGIAQFQSNATGIRTINIWTTSGYNGGGIGAKGVTVSATNGGRTDITTMQIVSHSSPVTYYLNALQNSGSTLNINTELKAVRIK